MRRRGTAGLLILAASTSLLACRPGAVELGFEPEPGDRYEYRYDIEVVVTRAVEDGEPEVTEIDTALLVEQEVQSRGDEGVRARVQLRRDGGAPRSAVVLLDRAGSLRGIELDGGTPGPLLGEPGLDASFEDVSVALPERPLAPGEQWSFEDGPRRGTARLARLGVVDGVEVAVVRTELTEDVDDVVEAGGGTTVVGTRSSETTTTYDLRDGAVRRATSSSSADLTALIAAPPGVEAEPVEASIRYEANVRVTRLDR